MPLAAGIHDCVKLRRTIGDEPLRRIDGVNTRRFEATAITSNESRKPRQIGPWRKTDKIWRRSPDL